MEREKRGRKKIIAGAPLCHEGQHQATHLVEGDMMLLMQSQKATNGY